MMPTETEIEHFLELYDAKNYTRAALRLGITQPTLTQSIFRLEEKIKSKLFHRTKQGCTPTRVGEIFYGKASHLHEVWKSLASDVAESETGLTGSFRIGCHVSVGVYTLPLFVKKIATEAPAIGIRVHHDWSRRITEKIVNHELDLGFVINPVRHRDLVLIKIGIDNVALWKTKKIAHVPKRLLTDLDLNQVRKLFGKHKVQEFDGWPIVETSSLEVVRAMTQVGAGVGLLPERVAKVGNSGLEMIKSALPQRKDEIYVAYRVGTMKGAAGKAVVEAAKNCIGTE